MNASFCHFGGPSIVVLKFKFESTHVVYSFVCLKTTNPKDLLGMPPLFFKPNINFDLPKRLFKKLIWHLERFQKRRGKISLSLYCRI